MKTKMFMLLSFVSAVRADVAGDLQVSINSAKEVVIKGPLTGLPVGTAGIHVHEGEQCDDSNKIGGHLFSNSIDGWVWPKAMTYDTGTDGTSKIKFTVKSYSVPKGAGTSAAPAVENHCIVMHGIASDPSPRVAIGKIVKTGNKYLAKMGKYPGPNPLSTTPAGEIEVTDKGNGIIELDGFVQNLDKQLKQVGIHIHAGTDCTGGNDVSSKAAVNAVVGGHLYYRGDGFATTTYTAAQDGASQIDIKTPKGAYTLLKSSATTDLPAVENRCIVIHNSKSDRIAVGKIVCAGTSCKASMGPYPKPTVPIAGDLTVSITGDKKVQIKGKLVGLPRSTTGAGIHVHSGKDCTNNGETSEYKIAAHIGTHLMSNYVDGWAFPKAITYDTDANGLAKIDVAASSHNLAKEDNTPAKPAVENHCIVLHGDPTNKAARVAIGQILKKGSTFSAEIKKYPGPDNPLKTTPSGTLVVTEDRGAVKLKGDISGLGKNLAGVGIHIHTGTDCTGGKDQNSQSSVNAVIGGHLRSQGDGFRTTTYNSNVNGESNINIETPAGSYTLFAKDETVNVPAVEKRCIVVHAQDTSRVGIGQILCSQGGLCSARIVEYPKPVGPLSGTLTVTYSAGKVMIKGDLNGVEKLNTDAGIHVHEGTQCADYNNIGGHLLSNFVDGWAYPTPITYDSDANGLAKIDVSASSYVLGGAGTIEQPSVENRCIVMHGVEPTNLSPRVAIGKIVKNGNAFTATMTNYPGSTALPKTPSGTITLTQEGNAVVLKGTVTNLGRGLKKAGIHIHTGKDCTGGNNKAVAAEVNKVVGGHLLSKGDGWFSTKYQSNKYAAASIDIASPKGSYVLLQQDSTSSDPPAVENHCIVVHNDGGTRIGVGKIDCKGGVVCKAQMGPYPAKPGPTTTTTAPPPTQAPTTTTILGGQSTTTAAATTTTVQSADDGENEDVSSAITNMLISFSALLVYAIGL